jgi:copper homeostasis protein
MQSIKNDLTIKQISPFRGLGLEICVDTIDAAIAAEKAGADRIELCANLNEGGTTPSFGYIEFVLNHLTIPVFPIIRPRSGDFLYTDAEFEIMKADVIKCKELGCKGIVLGLLKATGEVDILKTKQLVLSAGSMEVTFHRAFDRTNNSAKALKDVIDTGCKRILTSGLSITAYQGKIIIKQLVTDAKDAIIIMPGSGIRSNNLKKLIETTDAIEYHSSASIVAKSAMQFTNPNFGKNEVAYKAVDIKEIRKMKNILT